MRACLRLVEGLVLLRVLPRLERTLPCFLEGVSSA